MDKKIVNFECGCCTSKSTGNEIEGALATFSTIALDTAGELSLVPDYSTLVI